MSTDYTKTPNRAFPLRASLNTSQKPIALGQCRPGNRGYSWTAASFYTSRPRFRPFSWMGTGRAGMTHEAEHKKKTASLLVLMLHKVSPKRIASGLDRLKRILQYV